MMFEWIIKFSKKMIKKLGSDPNGEEFNQVYSEIENFYVSTATAAPTVLSGLENLLKVLSTMSNVTFCLGTGNLKKIAWKKHDLAGIA
jgi:hypothetical protein